MAPPAAPEVGFVTHEPHCVNCQMGLQEDITCVTKVGDAGHRCMNCRRCHLKCDNHVNASQRRRILAQRWLETDDDSEDEEED